MDNEVWIALRFAMGLARKDGRVPVRVWVVTVSGPAKGTVYGLPYLVDEMLRQPRLVCEDGHAYYL